LKTKNACQDDFRRVSIYQKRLRFVVLLTDTG
jgi:hypothetical protein